MAKLYFRYGAMNSGKTTGLLQTAHNYEERGQRVLIIKAVVDTKGEGTVVSRLGFSRAVDLLVDSDEDLRALVHRRILGRDAGAPSGGGRAGEEPKELRCALDCVLVDEAQFLTARQVDQLMEIVLLDDVPVLAYGIRSDFRTLSFPGSRRLLEIAHSLEELKTICRCGRKAIFNARKTGGQAGHYVFDGDQVAIDAGEITYESLCGKCYLAAGGALPHE
ncbi:thymidine kinase [Actinomyces slackii]|uniref:Thymidine kinase n=1 Tax=Actinomyces slackii TaxID=52774 RepID=A0A3S4U2T2_9ACTO|nr:thymidine kinase [Actinomyces slackii]VEG75089.1 Thymidine kinase [Actinomyces slackii]